MSVTSLSWKFDSGYAELLNTATVELRLKSGPSRTQLELHPKNLLAGKNNLVLDFSVDKPLSGCIPSCFAWTVSPTSEIKVTLIPEGNPFLGNFRVPEGQYAVQWKIIPAVSASVFPEESDSVSASAGTKLTHTWVEIFPEDTPVMKAIFAAWEKCVNPFDPDQAAGLSPCQVLRWNWTGLFRVTTGIGWTLEKGWRIETENLGFRYAMPAAVGAGFKSRVQLSASGHFYIQLSKKNGQLKFSLIREKGLDTSGSASIGIHFRNLPILSAENNLVDPILAPMEKAVKNCLSRKIRIALTAEAARWHRKKRIITASWQQPASNKIPEEYAAILAGEIPNPRDNFSVEGRFENVKGREFSIKINIFNRLAGFEKETSQFDSITVAPDGNLFLEKGISRTDIRYKWDETEFVRLAFSSRESQGQTAFIWNWETEGEFSRKKLKKLLLTVLHGKIIPGFTIQGNLHFPLKLKISTSTKFTGEGIEQVRQAPPSLQWDTLIRALTLVHPQRYQQGSYWRDWIDFPDVRQEIIRNPVHCHLDSCYPVRGRTEMQRRQVSGDYRRALRFLEVMDLWQEGMDPVVLLEKNLDFPIFLYFHLLCPPDAKCSDLIITGDWEMNWEQADRKRLG